MFEQEIVRVLGYAARGLGVRIVGPAGSGRTTVAKKVVDELEGQGAKVYGIFGLPPLSAAPFAGVLSLGLDLRSRVVGILGVSDLLSEHLARPGRRILVVDDVETLDRESLSVIDIVQKRTEVPIITTMGDSPFRVTMPALAVGRWPQATVALPPFRYEQVNSLIAEMLGHPADVDLAASVLTKSGGNLGLAVRIIETAVLSEQLVLRDGRWRMSGPTLFNEHLNATIEAMLHGLGPGEFRALSTMAVLGPTPVDRLTSVAGIDALDALEHRGLVSVVPAPDGTLLGSVFPPLVEDYLTRHIASSRRILGSTIAGEFAPLAIGHGDTAAPGARTGAAEAALAALRAELKGNQVATSRYFHRRLDALEQFHYRIWDSDRSMANAVALLRVYWGAPIDPHRIQEVFASTNVAEGDPADLLFFTMTRALWTVMNEEGGLERAKEIVRETAESEPTWASEAEAAALFLEATYNGVPGDLDERFARLASLHPKSGLVAAVRGAIELYRFDPQAALDAIDSAEGFESLPRFEPFIRGMALFTSGRIDEALVYALERRQEALRAVDQFSLLTSSYVAALALLYRGCFDEGEYLMGWAFSLRRPGFLVDSLYNAMLRLSSLRSAGEVSLGTQAGTGAGTPDVGPFPGTGKGYFELVTRRPVTLDSFDETAARLMDEALDRGYVTEAVMTGLSTLCLLPSHGTLRRLERLLVDFGSARHDQLLGVAGAALGGDLKRLVAVLDDYRPDEDVYQTAVLLRGAARRYRILGDSSTATAIERAANAFSRRLRTGGQYLILEPEVAASALTARETEVALMVGQKSNQEIAEQFGLSVRTVESHVSNALRKTGATTRGALFELVRDMVS
ncbi:LuxR C-terminal-related transcriptional regulator [Sinomonas sp. P47F7]|uniref:LuxR C-terminal-related transcriptional regulator n=1 Tax=Sinomonas sp. P47F7 TaxID=3410987 RepID=UPI003BF4DEBF